MIRKTIFPVTFAYILFAAVLLSFTNNVALATTYTVNNLAGTTTGSGTSGTLRYCVNQVNAGSGGDVINFSVTGVISLQGSITLSKSVTINGTSAPTYSGVPLIEVTNGASVTTGFNITAANCVIKALSITNFSTRGINISTSENLIAMCYIGVRLDGTTTLANGNGINITADGNTIGGANAGNVISGNTTTGITISSTGNTIQGNIIGMNAAGNAAVPNVTNGITLNTGGNTNNIGGTVTGTGNFISGNTLAGILIQGTCTGNTVQGNIIGMNVAGTAAVPNGANGVQINSTANTNTVGGASGAGNFISGNTGHGISVSSSGNVIKGNTIGLNTTGTDTVANTNNGIQLNSTAALTIVGGTATHEGNIISGNRSNGITVSSSENTIVGNIIGMDPSGNLALSNKGNGITINSGANTNNIGGITTGSGNFISGNKNTGLSVSGTGNMIQGNTIGMDVAGTVAIANGANGITLNAGPNTVGGTATGAGNYISGNTNSGISVNSTGNTIQGNIIGMDAAGTVAVANGNNGVTLNSGADGNNVGGSVTGAGNFISGNTSAGINVSSAGNTIQKNTIGLNAAGTAAVANGTNGITLNTNGNTNNIGGVDAGNVISGNIGSGILIQGTATGNIIKGNTIGMDAAGTAAVPNGDNGIQLNSSASTNNIGGSASGEGNFISGNTGHGISVSSGTNTIQGNTIGLNAAGTAAVANSINGIQLNSGAGITIIGGSTTGAGNIISGNSVAGLSINSSANTIEGNTIGMNVTGTSAIGNGTHGITLTSGASANIIGGTTTGAGNFISGNTASGVSINSSSNTVQGNTIGMNAAGTAAVANGTNGITLNTGANTNNIGGTATGAGNYISGNTGNGIFAQGTSTGNTIQGNTIGLNTAGTAAVANLHGIQLNSGASTVTIGGTAAGAGNVISGNTYEGVYVNSTGNTIQGNIIGMDAAGAYAIGNQTGIDVSGTTNTIGGNTAAARNYLSGNTSDGIHLYGNNNTIQGNYIGINKAGTAAVSNTYQGIWADNNASNNQIGGTGVGDGNVISGNNEAGVFINTGSGNVLQGNIIGMDPTVTTAIPNALAGVLIVSSSNTIGGSIAGAGNTIAGNTLSGVSVVDGNSNKISGNSIYNNGGIGIDLNINGLGISLNADGPTLNDALDADSGPNNLVNFPVITSLVQGGGNTTISGSYDGGPSGTFTIELFSNTALDPSGFGEGQTYLGSTTVNTNGSGHGTFSTVVTGLYSLVTATATDAANNTSEFSYSGLSFVNTTPQSFTLCQDATATSIKSLLHVSDPQLGQTITWSLASDPVHGIVNLSGDTASSGSSDITPAGVITYDPAGYTGSDSFVIEATDGTSTVSMVVNVTVNPIQRVIGSDTVTFGLTTTLTDSVSGGTWSTTTPWITKVTAATGAVKGVSAGVSVVTYTTALGCTATHTVTVMSGINACVGQTITISDGLATGGTWTSSSNSIATVGLTSGAITGISAGNVVITHKLSPVAISTTTIKVNPLGTTTAVPTSVCQGQTIAMTNNTLGGGTWYSGNTTTAVISAGGTVLGVAGGNVTIYFTPQAGCVTTKTITVNPVTPISGPATVCAGQSVTLTNTAGGGTWSTSNGSLATVYNGIVGGVAAGVPNISYKWPTGCFATAAMTVKALSPISGGVTSLCQNATMTLTNTTAGGGNWSADNNFSVNGSGVVTGVGTGTGNIYFTANNGCITSKAATVTQSPVIGGTPSVCVGQTTLLNSSMTGGTWSTTNGSLATVYNGIVGGVTAGTPTISYKVPGGCFGIAAVTVKALSPIAGGNTSICPSGTTTYTNATPGGGAWSSSLPSVANINGAGLVTGAGAAAGSKTVVSFTSTTNACVATRTVTIVACREGENTTETETITPVSFDVRLYPNPNNGSFTLKGTIDITNGEAVNAEIVNMLGQVVYRSKVNVQNGKIDEHIQLRDNLAPGMYILNMHATSGSKLFHFVLGQ